MREIILLKLGEMVLKGLNRRSFEDKLMGNAKRRLNNYGSFQGVYPPVHHLCGASGRKLRLGRGLAGHGAGCSAWWACARARACPKDKDAIVACRQGVPGGQAARPPATFKVESKRADKSFPMTSHPAVPVCGRRAPRRLSPPDRWTSTTRSSPSMWRSGTTRPLSTPTRSRGRAACPWAWAAGR